MQNETERQYEEVKQKFEEAVKLFYEKKLNQAKAIFSEIGEKFSQYREFKHRSEVFLRIIEKLESPVEERTTFQDRLNNVVAAINEKDPEYALELLQQFREEDPRLYYLKALAYALLEREEEALENLKKAVEMDVRFKFLAKSEPDLAQLRDKGLLDQL